jgi:hypothetical protein
MMRMVVMGRACGGAGSGADEDDDCDESWWAMSTGAQSPRDEGNQEPSDRALRNQELLDEIHQLAEHASKALMDGARGLSPREAEATKQVMVVVIMMMMMTMMMMMMMNMKKWRKGEKEEDDEKSEDDDATMLRPPGAGAAEQVMLLHQKLDERSAACQSYQKALKIAKIEFGRRLG